MGKEEIKYLTLFLLATMGEMEAAVCMTDHFDKIQKLPDPIPGCPNFRRVPGFKVYCSGQPTIEGFEKALEKVCGTIYPKDGPIIWFNLRQEPTVYVNGNPICARPANKIGEYAELGAITRDIIKAQETAFLGECEGRKSVGGGKLKVVDVNKKESEVEVKIEGSFVDFVEKCGGLREMVEKGKGNLQWERDIPPAALSNLENLANTDFKSNLGKIIHDIYQTAHLMFADMPQGDHKKRAKYRFASKTLMRILPTAAKTEVEGLIEKKKISLDLYEILGVCTWVEPK